MDRDAIRRLTLAAMLQCLLVATLAAQIIIWPPYPPTPPPRPRPIPPSVPMREVEVRELSVDAVVRDQVARVQLSQKFHNPNGSQMETQYLFAVPPDSTIQDFVLMVDGDEIAGELMDRDEAERIYREIVRTQKDPALLEWVGRGLLRTSVFPIPGHGERTVTLSYTMLLPRDGDRMETVVPLGAPGSDPRPVQKLDVRVRLEQTQPIRTLYSPTDGVEIDRDGERRATARLQRNNQAPPAELRLIAGMDERPVGATLLSTRPSAGEDGYFLLILSPAIGEGNQAPIDKNVVFVIDRSGSMSGRKIEQAREALSFVLNNLGPGDTFNIVVYDDLVETFRPELQRFNEGTRQAAQAFVANIRAGGSTNIDEALRVALEMLPEDHSRPSYVIFLTDGLPTVGEQNELKIAEHAKAANRARARIFSFGVGYDVNARLLTRLSRDNNGTTEYVRPEDDLEVSVSRFYGRMSSPVLSDPELTIDGVRINRQTPRELPDLFSGNQVILTGRYSGDGEAEVRLSGRIGDRGETFHYPVHFAESGRGAQNAFIERLWAARRIGDLTDEIDLQGQNDELVDEIVALSKRYGILTPYTSFLAREDTDLTQRRGLRQQARDQLTMLDQESGASGVQQRMLSQGLQRADTGAAAENIIWNYSGPAGAAGAATQSRGARSVQMDAPMTFVPPAVATADAAPEETVRTAGTQAFYRREGAWLAADAIEQDQSQMQTIVAYTEEWFDLAKQLGSARAAWLDFEEPVVFLFEGQLYRVVQQPEG